MWESDVQRGKSEEIPVERDEGSGRAATISKRKKRVVKTIIETPAVADASEEELDVFEGCTSSNSDFFF